jgi:DNA-binding PadR family transcriptional regulator
MTAVNLKPISYLVLGMLRLGAKSGYMIKKGADLSTSTFWPTSLAQVYPELARLERHGLVTRKDDPRGALKRAAYELTPEGEEALLAWLRSSRTAPTQLRSEAMLRLFFADALPKDEQGALVRRMREKSKELQSNLTAVNLRAAMDDFGENEVRFPLLVKHWGEALLSQTAEFLDELERELERIDG